jgi:hypothetical protein
MAALRTRLEAMYRDLEPLNEMNVGTKVADAYNGLFSEASNLLGDEPASKGITKVDSSEHGVTVRLLVGQLVLLVGNN